MSKTYQDQIPPETGRRYSISANADGTSSITDVTQYLQEGTPWGAADANDVYSKAAEARELAANALQTSGGTISGDLAVTGSVTIDGADVASAIGAAQSKADAAQTTANAAQTLAGAAMPISGGMFTGNVEAINSNRTVNCVRNIYLNGVNTNYILMVRK